MAIKKSELYSSLWKSCDELRGGMDASQYKNYVLVLLFVKYVSDKYADVEDALIEIPQGGSFQDIVNLKGKKDIGEKINLIIQNLAQANDLGNIFNDADFNDPDKLGKGQEMQQRLTNLVAIFENSALNFSKNRADGDDILGDAYEYLMRNFATQSGKSKGQFYTPAEVSRVIAKVIGINSVTSPQQSIYDPTCGSGSLLLKAADETEIKISIFGQEMDNATYSLARMNMILHGHPTAEIKQDNTLSTPHFKNSDGSLKTFDFAVANPPFSAKAWSTGINLEKDEFQRFSDYGIPPAKNGDYAFLLHLIASLKPQGKGAIILPHGVLFRGNAEADIRKKIINQGIIKGIIGLPPNLFYGTGIPACIIVIDKENAGKSAGIFMIDASKGFVKDGNKNRLREQDIHKIVDVFNKQLEIAKYSRMVSLTEIADNDFNLNIPRYIDSQEAEDIQDIAAHLLGGIPEKDIQALGEFWQVYPNLQQELFAPTQNPGYQQLKVAANEVKNCIFHHPEFIQYSQKIEQVFTTWEKQHTPLLKAIQPGDKPREIIYKLGENLLAAFTGQNLIDKYDVYQYLLTYWLEVMGDDVYMIVEDGWKAEMAMYGQGKTRGKIAILGIDASVNQACAAININKDICNKYLFFYLASNYEEIRKLSNTGNQENLNGKIIKSILIPLPPLAEQKAIAQSLSDVDNLITAIDKLITKKRNIKQGTMQELLTGKKRLPGFTGEWEVKKLGDVGECIIGLTYKPENVKESGLLVLRSSNIADNQLKFDDNVFVNIEIPDKLITKKGDILICVRNGSRQLIGKNALINKKHEGLTFGAFMSIYRTKFYEYIFHAFQSSAIKKQIHENIGATINQITNKNLNSFEILIPPTIEEQKAIAKILTEMDEEIEALEKKREKYKNIKQGMMQELLTGKTRIIDN